ncbi:hypothetical protein SLEP1_g58784 [Rubroshorea leprosula]|uniref:CCHC-type domain-containing protein n=1 Tax=Rubroshorea leprosula TaxID=152421 RepID=A0AAV5MQK4_9ROSI|nr:hypothetical protein SLEP1_g58784 [Rubroshorea leprosula]
MAEPSIRDLTVALGGKLSLTAEEDVGLDLDADEQNNQSMGAAKWCLVGTLLIRRRYNLEALENTLASVWWPIKGMHMRILGENLFAFYFFHPVDMQRVLAKGPWHFVNHTMILKEAHGGRQIKKEDMFEVPFWIQIHGDGDAWGSEFIRVRVDIDTKKPLRRGMKLSLKDEPIWVSFRYERLQNFCYCCGKLDHVDRDCELGLEMDIVGTMNRPYNDTLRAVSQRAQLAKSTSTGKWLRDGSGNYVVEEARWRRARPNMESPRAWDTQESHKGGNSRDRWAEGAHMGANHGRECYGLHSLDFNVEDVIHNISPRLIPLSTGGDVRKEVNDNTRSGKTNGDMGKLMEKALEWENIQKISSSQPDANGPQLDDARQTHMLQNPAQNDQGKELSPVFTFTSKPDAEGTSMKTRAWKKEARHRRTTTMVVFLCETLLDKRSMERVRRRLGFQNCFTVERVGRSGGLAMMWGKDVQLHLKSYSTNHIDMEVQAVGGTKWRFTGFYGYPERHNRRKSWVLIRELAGKSSFPWLIGGDFNDILSLDEKVGGGPQPDWMLRGFQEVINDCNLTEIQMVRGWFTWRRGRTEEKLDHCLGTISWRNLFPLAKKRRETQSCMKLFCTLEEKPPENLFCTEGEGQPHKSALQIENARPKSVCRRATLPPSLLGRS